MQCVGAACSVAIELSAVKFLLSIEQCSSDLLDEFWVLFCSLGQGDHGEWILGMLHILEEYAEKVELQLMGLFVLKYRKNWPRINIVWIQGK